MSHQYGNYLVATEPGEMCRIFPVLLEMAQQSLKEIGGEFTELKFTFNKKIEQYDPISKKTVVSYASAWRATQ